MNNVYVIKFLYADEKNTVKDIAVFSSQQLAKKCIKNEIHKFVENHGAKKCSWKYDGANRWGNGSSAYWFEKWQVNQ